MAASSTNAADIAAVEPARYSSDRQLLDAHPCGIHSHNESSIWPDQHLERTAQTCISAWGLLERVGAYGLWSEVHHSLVQGILPCARICLQHFVLGKRFSSRRHDVPLKLIVYRRTSGLAS